MMLPLRSVRRRWPRPALAALALAVFGSAPSLAQRAVSVTGTVVDARSGQAIAGVLGDVSPGERRTATDAEGRFRLRLRTGAYLANVSHLTGRMHPITTRR